MCVELVQGRVRWGEEKSRSMLSAARYAPLRRYHVDLYAAPRLERMRALFANEHGFTNPSICDD